jgi:hypothetical protein
VGIFDVASIRGLSLVSEEGFEQHQPAWTGKR